VMIRIRCRRATIPKMEPAIRNAIFLVAIPIIFSSKVVNYGKEFKQNLPSASSYRANYLTKGNHYAWSNKSPVWRSQ
jgi:hypothetical protein